MFALDSYKDWIVRKPLSFVEIVYTATDQGWGYSGQGKLAVRLMRKYDDKDEFWQVCYKMLQFFYILFY
jgi:hypothetical protein